MSIEVGDIVAVAEVQELVSVYRTNLKVLMHNEESALLEDTAGDTEVVPLKFIYPWIPPVTITDSRIMREIKAAFQNCPDDNPEMSERWEEIFNMFPDFRVLEKQISED